MPRIPSIWVDPETVGLIGYINRPDYSGLARVYIAKDAEATDWIEPNIGLVDVHVGKLKEKANDAYFSAKGENALYDRIVGLVKGKNATYYLYSSGKVRRQARSTVWYNYWCYEELSEEDLKSLV